MGEALCTRGAEIIAAQQAAFERKRQIFYLPIETGANDILFEGQDGRPLRHWRKGNLDGGLSSRRPTVVAQNTQRPTTIANHNWTRRSAWMY